MASIETQGAGKQVHSGRPKKTVHVDFTPMVDLGFLLITFFMLTTSLLKPKTMEIQKPKDAPNPTVISKSQAMTVFLTRNNKILYYFGMPDQIKGPQDLKITDFSKGGIRSILRVANKERNPKADSIQIYKDLARNNKISEWAYMQKRHRIEEEFANKALMVLIKTEDHSVYNNMVDILDEMSINNIRSYALVDINPMETKLVQARVH